MLPCAWLFHALGRSRAANEDISHFSFATAPPRKFRKKCAFKRKGLPINVALDPVDMRLGSEQLGALVREKMRMEPRSRALLVFVGKRGHSMKCLTHKQSTALSGGDSGPAVLAARAVP
jgi:hypothetical protein